MNINAHITQRNTPHMPCSTFTFCSYYMRLNHSNQIFVFFLFVFCCCRLKKTTSNQASTSFRPCLLLCNMFSHVSAWRFLLEMNFTVIVIKEKATHRKKNRNLCCVALKMGWMGSIFQWLGILIRPQNVHRRGCVVEPEMTFSAFSIKWWIVCYIENMKATKFCWY